MVEILLGALIMLIGVLVGYAISDSVKNTKPINLDEMDRNWRDISLKDTDHITLADHTTRHAAFGDYGCTLPRIHQGLCLPPRKD